MGLLLLINGLPGSGKSTLAARYAAERPLSLCLDIDVVRELLGRWQDDRHDAGRLARRMALAMAHEVLVDGHDVVAPQLVAKGTFIDQLEALARRCDADFVEIVLRQDLDRALAQLAARAAGPMTAAQRSAHLLIDRAGGPDVVIPEAHRQLTELHRNRPRSRSLEPTPGDVDATFRTLLDLLDD